MAPGEVATIDSAAELAAQALLNLRCAVDHCHDAVFITDSGGKIEYLNPAFEALTGYSAMEIKETGLGLILEVNSGGKGKGAVSDPGQEFLDDVLEHGVHRRAVRVVRKDGHRIDLDVAMTVVRDYEAQTASIVCTGRDITEESELRTEIRDARRFDTVATVASGVAHDLNNLMMVIHAYAELGLQTLYCEHPLRRNLREILAAARRAADLTRQLLSSGRSLVPGIQVVKLNTIIEDACLLLPRVLGEDVELRVALNEDDSWIKTDPSQLERALFNLAANARDATPSGGMFSIKTSLVSLDANAMELGTQGTESKYLLLEVEDSGKGISAEELSKVFLPFYSTKTEGQGNGLGLSVVERAVKLSGGFIRVESMVNQGTTFRLYFPVAEHSSGKGAEVKAVNGALPGGSETVLLVEDDDAVRESIAEFVSSLGYQVLCAPNGEEALKVASQHHGKIDVLISDVVMPRMNSTELAESLTRSRPGIQVLLVSGHSSSVLERKGVVNTEEVLRKPYSLSLLATQLRTKLQPETKAQAATAGAK